MELIRVLDTGDFVVDYDKEHDRYRVSVFQDCHYQDECWFNAYRDEQVEGWRI